jgi:hypothetical protein
MIGHGRRARSHGSPDEEISPRSGCGFIEQKRQEKGVHPGKSSSDPIEQALLRRMNPKMKQETAEGNKKKDPDQLPSLFPEHSSVPLTRLLGFPNECFRSHIIYPFHFVKGETNDQQKMKKYACQKRQLRIKGFW